jgi:hypothetical protein
MRSEFASLRRKNWGVRFSFASQFFSKKKIAFAIDFFQIWIPGVWSTTIAGQVTNNCRLPATVLFARILNPACTCKFDGCCFRIRLYVSTSTGIFRHSLNIYFRFVFQLLFYSSVFSRSQNSTDAKCNPHSNPQVLVRRLPRTWCPNTRRFRAPGPFKNYFRNFND